MKVLHILNELKPSGAEVMLKEAASKWIADGVVSHIISTGEKEGSYAPSLKRAGYEVLHLPWSKGWRFPLALFRFIREERFDAVHIHPERANFLYGYIAKLAGAKTVVRSIHNVFPFKGLVRLRGVVQRFLLRRVGVKMCAVSRRVVATERKIFFNKSQLVPNWIGSGFEPVDLSRKEALREKLKIPKDSFVLMSVGNCNGAKNHSVIFEAISMLREYQNILYVHVGIEDAQGTERVLADRLGVAGNVRFIGASDQVRDYLQASDIFLMPSLYEGLGVAAVEAIACGIPAVLSDVDGLDELKGLGEGIFWVEPTAKSVKDAVVEVFNMSDTERGERCSRLSDQARTVYSVQRGAQQYFEIYRRNVA